MVVHFRVNFRSIGFADIAWKKQQTDKQTNKHTNAVKTLPTRLAST